ncbi:MAG: TetR/AcrR family transcriptional regulator [Acidobacteriota bacterium]
MTSKDRREREKEALRQEILDAARDLFVQEGYENVSMRRIAEKIDYSPTTIYLYFEDKADLLFHLCEETFKRLVVKGEKILAEKTDPLTKVKKIGRNYIEFGLRHPNHYKVTFMVQHSHEEMKQRYENSTGHRAFELLQSSVEECIRAGIFKRVDPSIASQALWAAVHGITSLLIAKPHFPWVEKQKTIDLVLDSVCAGLSRDKKKSTATQPARA